MSMSNKTSESPIQAFERLHRQYELPTKIISLFRNYLRTDKEGAISLARQLADIVDSSSPTPSRNINTSTDRSFALIRQVLMNSGNNGLTREQLEQETGIGEHTMHTMLYRSHKDFFDAKPHPEGGRKRLYQLNLNGIDAG